MVSAFPFNLRPLVLACLAGVTALPVAADELLNGPGAFDLELGGVSSNSQSALSSSGYVFAQTVGSKGGPTRVTLWSVLDGVRYLPTLGGKSMAAYGLSHDGLVVIGTVGSTSSRIHAFRWDASNGTQDLGVLPGMDSSRALATNASGSIVVGESGSSHTSLNRAFRWSESGGMQDLGDLGGGKALAKNVNAVGDVVVGESTDHQGAVHAFRWTSQGGMQDLSLPGAQYSTANAVNDAGNVVVGRFFGASTGMLIHAFRWTADGGLQDLGALGRGTSEALAVNGSGDVVVGRSIPMRGSPRAFRWTVATGMQTVEDWLRSNGFDSGAMKATSATGVSDDGNVIIGQLAGGHTYVAFARRGIVDMPDVARSLAAMQQPFEMQRQQLERLAADADCNRFGAHGLCVAASVGRRDSTGGAASYRDPSASVSVGVRLGQHWRIGATLAQGQLDIGGELGSRVRQTAPALAVSLGYGADDGLGWQLRAAVSASNGSMDFTRGYLNGARLERAHGTTRADAQAVSLRSGYGLSLGRVVMTPYLQARSSHSRWSAYREVDDVRFPAAFEARNSKVVTLGAGAQAQWQVNDRWSVGLDGGVEQEIQRDDQESVANVLGYVYSDAGLTEAPAQTLPFLGGEVTRRVGSDSEVALGAGWRATGFGAGERYYSLTWRHAF